ncbi:unnamed protein product (macronuclear) [Paramecium tetraurelia]|uniref:Chromosome undetermined scaffold_150, whole genome shotgun sequence n=1 Tax=Paramecium tetraurelia TaxID=5888 RepID=Q3SED6_PARTE|nr:uncharacterized protein GSPATT00035261001 [Paramecium tetraurelia]CAI38988.1 VAMP-associated protein 2-1 [Paramecium tetraurelia]CAK66132.1 unnamed protein product [Paramecium tetraurelia]|eukprot:XP_001433529.1 hypothetical protein (macronuclear) [Paramecium tetraurelia strain d4-2]
MQGLIEIEPKQFLEFEAEENKLAHAQLSLKNLTQQDVAFKIKTTTPTLFQVKPSVGVININQTQLIEISTSQPIKADAKFDPKFQVNACFIDFPDQDLTQFWKNRDQSTIQSQQIKSRIKQQNAQQDAQSFQSVPDSKILDSNASVSQQQESKMFKSVIEPKSEKDDQIKQYQDQFEKLQQEYLEFRKKIEAETQQAQLKKDKNNLSISQLLLAVVIALVAGYFIGN